MPDLPLIPLILVAWQHRCACSDATRVEVGSLSIPVGPATALLAFVVALFGPAALLGWWTRRRHARAMQEILTP